MNTKNILFATDFSESSEAAQRYASLLAAESGAMLHIVHVADDSPAYIAGYTGFGYVPELPDQVAQENEKRLAQIKPTSNGVRHQHHYLTGVAEQEILAFAEKENIDLIVIGSHGRTGLSRLLLGSVAEAVARRAKCPVLTVKQPQAEQAEAERESQSAAHHGPRSRSSLH